jgi:hypothetical protein
VIISVAPAIIAVNASAEVAIATILPQSSTRKTGIAAVVLIGNRIPINDSVIIESEFDLL